MRKLSRFGAAALALALSVTFLTPVQAQAAKPENYGASLKLKEDIPDRGVIDVDKITIGDITGKANDKQSAYENALENIALALAGKGLATTTKPAIETNKYDEIETADGTKYYTWYDWDNIDYNDDVTFKGVYTWKYTNTQTKKSSVFLKEVQNNYTSDEAKARSFQSALRVKKGEITYVEVPLTGGDTTIEKVKSSKKSIAKVSIYNKISSDTTDTTERHVEYEEVTDPTTKKTSYTVYYYTTVGARVVVGTYESLEDAEKAMNEAEAIASTSAVRYLKVDAKKSGKTKLTFNIKNKNGNISKVSTTIFVVDDDDIFSKLTYAGQSLLADKDLEKKSFYETGSGNFFTTKAKGKLVAKANKNFVIKKIEVGRYYTENYNYGMEGTYPDGSKYDNSGSYSAYSSTGKITKHMVDLNGDGDYDDTINGISERLVTYKYKKVKSGKTIKLSKVGEKYDSSFSSTKKDKNWFNDEYGSVSSTSKTRNFSAPTEIRITYYDKLLKNYGTATYTIRLKVSK